MWSKHDMRLMNMMRSISSECNVTNMYSQRRVYDNKETYLYEHSNEGIEQNTLNTNDEMRYHLMSYIILILEVNFQDV